MSVILPSADARPLIEEMARLTKDDIETILREWQRRLNLNHWRIDINWDEEAVNGSDADFTANDWYDTAYLRFNNDYSKWQRREANVTVVHELCHLILRDLMTAVRHVAPKFPKAAWEPWSGWIEASQEKAVEHLAQVLVDLGGVV